MCGRFGVPFRGEDLADALGAPWHGEPLRGPRYNVAPTQHAPVLLDAGAEGRRLQMVRWGLIPSWAKDPSIGSKMINARAESVAEKPSFRTAFKKRRCLVPVGGFYEWKKEGKTKTPHWIHPASAGVVTFAGLWERWFPEGAEPVTTFTILTTGANGFMSALHDRMPVIVEPEDRDAWLDAKTDPAAVSALLRPCAEDRLAAYAVSTRVNSPANEDETLISRL